MCGIAGYFSPLEALAGAELALRMLRSIEHRGPDDQGLTFFDLVRSCDLDTTTPRTDVRIRDAKPPIGAGHGFAHHLAFAHCRYSVIDLSPGGHQPMWDASGRVCVCFNGEIYNYVELRQELESAGQQFRSHSDTEVLIAGYLRWGADVFRRLNGQWALSLYDKRERALWLSRDRFGKVPLYYTVHRGRLYWASEIKALLEACGPAAFSVRAQAVDDFVVHGWRDRDGTFWNEVMDFPPACYARVRRDLSLEVSRYWRLPGERMRAASISTLEASRRVAELLLDAIRIRARADVPVAFELSGGVDSSTIVALAASRLDSGVTAYSIEFPEKEANEERFARAVADRFPGRIDYRVIRPGKEDFRREADDFVWLEEEPFHAPNLHTNQSLRRRMKEAGTKVVISGSAGDEVFAGYHDEYFAPYLRYLGASLKWGRLLRELGANTELDGDWKRTAVAAMDACAPRLRGFLRRARPNASDPLGACYSAPSGVTPRAPMPGSLALKMQANMGAAKMNYWLRSANKANFGIPIEPRAPYLDYRVVDFAFSLPLEFLIRDGWHKWILRKAAGTLLPSDVLWRRRKMGFPFPLSSWLDVSKPWLLDTLADSSCPYLNREALRARYDVLAQRAPFALWRLISVGLWWRRIIERRSIATGRAA